MGRMKRFSGRTGAALFAVLVLAALGGCMNSENPDLLNAPLAQESIRVRLLNLAGDRGDRQLQLEHTLRTVQTPYAGLSPAVSSPADSVIAAIMLNDTEEYATEYRLRFSRNALFTVIALPSSNYTTAVDTLLVLAGTDSVEVRPNRVSYLRFVNAYAGSASQFSLRLGCPNGTVLSPAMQYRGISGTTEIPPGPAYTVSLVEHTGTTEQPVGYYNMPIGDNSNYTLVLYNEETNTPGLLLLHDRGGDPTALQPLHSVPASQAELRVLNFSTQPVDVAKVAAGQSDEEIVSDVPARTAGAYAGVTACTSPTEDTLRIGGIPHVVGVPLEVLKRYTIITIDSGSAAANYSVALPPPSLAPTSDSAVIRTVNLAWDTPALEISLGARTTAGGSYVTGRVLTPTLEFGTAGAPQRFAPGAAPFVVFTNAPKQLRAAAYVDDLRPGGQYLLVVTREGGQLRLSLFDENDNTVRPLQFLNEGVFTQVVNAVPDAQQLSFSYGNVIQNHSLFYGSASATVLPVGTHQFSAGGKQATVTLESNKRTLVLVSGPAANPDITAFTTDPMGAGPREIRRRFINGAPSVPALTVRLESNEGKVLADNIPYPELSKTDVEKIERKVTLIFMESASGTQLLQRNNIPFSYGTNFTIILAGSTPEQYRAILLQEF